MKSLSLLSALCISASSALAQDELPSNARDLVDKLAIFSKETREKAESEIRVKERQVAEILESHLQAETKAGNLNGALAIQKVINELSPEKPPIEEEKRKKVEPVAESGDELGFLNHIWASAQGAQDVTFQFFTNGTGIKDFRGEPRNITWTMNNDGFVVVKTPVGDEVFHFGKRSSDCYLITPDGKQKIPWEIIDKAKKQD